MIAAASDLTLSQVTMPLEWLGIVMARSPARTGDEGGQLWQ
jgi:hypothetical protein